MVKKWKKKGAGNRNPLKSISHPGLFLKRKGGATAKIRKSKQSMPGCMGSRQCFLPGKKC
jgi:hypothetical protein